MTARPRLDPDIRRRVYGAEEEIESAREEARERQARRRLRKRAPDLRWLAWKRDQGVCSLCSVDTEALKREFQVKVAEGFSPRSPEGKAWLGRYGIPWANANGVEWWEADHIIPLVEGGSHGLSNCRTLCLRCHRRATRELAWRRATNRRALKPSLDWRDVDCSMND